MKTKQVASVVSLALSLFLVTGCAQVDHKANVNSKETVKQTKVTYSDEQLRSNENTMSVLWYQRAAEAKALYLQGYQLATDRLKNQLGQATDKPYSIVLDIDETVLDNSPYQAKNILEGTSFTPESWDVWVQKKEAKPVAGAKEFLQFADQNGIQIYYISDRSASQVDATMENLQKEGIPVQGRDHLLFLEEGVKSKEARRQKVKETTNLIMLFGDNLVDFADFSKKSEEDRTALLSELQEEFGRQFIIFPNPMYGSWESAVYKGEKLDASHQLKERRKALESFEK
ncbi:5'-nucleotidase, lipoprotein e(P4) family [Streptococcus dysgalactiae]|uniref:5'-nucleotidase, lipoprotein e(P4) family n=1 Tax=Streptococcus dysgalactiae TaxID=1334 RepID=UPI000F6D8BEC|nr:5'-nucleotidase, lipoprotein e(P4) family [Streptococcus dysgalactiae]MEE3742481.1 5'-nucleotidase, lipoprotein e(P4) family [Streptococcus dysgalactiae]VDZ41262.1 acid phosphatase [Streptococcus dysgalactiae subsp. dysgalactiae]